MGISIWQILLIVLVVVVLFGAGKLPRLMGDFAKGIKSFKTGMREGEAPPSPQSAAATADAPQEPKVIESEAAPIEASAVKKTKPSRARLRRRTAAEKQGDRPLPQREQECSTSAGKNSSS